jgi:hypothetical protein
MGLRNYHWGIYGRNGLDNKLKFHGNAVGEPRHSRLT